MSVSWDCFAVTHQANPLSNVHEGLSPPECASPLGAGVQKYAKQCSSYKSYSEKSHVDVIAMNSLGQLPLFLLKNQDHCCIATTTFCILSLRRLRLKLAPVPIHIRERLPFKSRTLLIGRNSKADWLAAGEAKEGHIGMQPDSIGQCSQL